MHKTYVLDTSILIQNPNAIFLFEDNDIIIADATIEELDKLKKEKTERGHNAREAIRNIKKIREKGNLLQGIQLDDGGILKVETNCVHVKMPERWDNSCDNRILRVCKGHCESGEKVILVTSDEIMAIKADMLGIEAQSFTTEQTEELKNQYTGRKSVYTDTETINQFYQDKKDDCDNAAIDVLKTFVYHNDNISYLTVDDYVKNEFVLLTDANCATHTALGYFNGKQIVPLLYQNKRPFGVTPRSIGQIFFQEALMRSAEEAPLVICKGPAGTAKTFYSLAVGLEKTMNRTEEGYRKILVCRPNVKMDEDIGFLPGDEQEKIAPYLRPVMDNLEILCDAVKKSNNEKQIENKVSDVIDFGRITFEAIAYMRGRSIVNNWVIIDEAQNLTPNQVKGIITRAGAGTKIILVGDPEQIDHQYLDERTNGLSYASEKMKNSSLCWQITMADKECERSVLSQDAAKRL